MIEPRVAENPPARFILCERRDHWAVSLARSVPSIRAMLYETRSIPQAWDALCLSPASFLGLELTENNFEGVVRGLKHLSRDYPRARAIIFANRALQHYEWILRESGAIDFLVSPRRIQQLAAMADCHIRLAQTDSQIGDQTIWQRLPWRPRHDTNEPTRVHNTDC
ncbi:MAG: hypothetical protein VX644_17130 [Planctomycetota bacterium]|nr:hypothetical protein [Planctomycetota bacterium]